MKHFHAISRAELLSTVIGILGGIGLISFLTYASDYPLLVAPFGASAVLLYSATSSPLAQPRNLIGGHLIAAFIGTSCYQLLGETWYAVTLSVTCTILLMMVSNTIHPPGGATAIVAVLNHASYGFVLFPIAIGVVILLSSAYFANKLSPQRSYPMSLAKK
ncbi:MAG: HPP family protein [Peptococcaceae bacterium]|nr:HPP family protein [Peptococcaceae bacterium]